jgi:hypothetical protein
MSKLNELEKQWKEWNAKKPDERETRIDLDDNWKLDLDFQREDCTLRRVTSNSYTREGIMIPMKVLEELHKALNDLYKE